MTRALILALLCACAASAQPRTFKFHESGGGLIALDEAPVRVADMRVVIEGIVERGSIEAWQVTSDLILENEGPEVTLRVGFPFEIEAQLAPALQARWGRTYDFEATTRGAPVTPTRVDLTAEPARGVPFAYAWPITLAPDERVGVHFSYLTHFVRMPNASVFPHYTLKTLAGWHGGRAGRLRLEIQPNVPFKVNQSQMRRMLTGGRLEGEGAGQRLVWELADHAPTKDLFTSLILGPEEALWDELPKIEEELRWARRRAALIILGRHGFIPDDRVARRFLSQLWWYAPDPEFNVTRLTEEDRAALERTGIPSPPVFEGFVGSFWHGDLCADVYAGPSFPASDWSGTGAPQLGPPCGLAAVRLGRCDQRQSGRAYFVHVAHHYLSSSQPTEEGLQARCEGLGGVWYPR